MRLYDLPLYRVFWRTRRLFQRLGAEFEPVPGGAPLSAPQRAVLEFLDRGGAQTVPELARSRSVSRQHIQSSVNELVELGWIETRPNPAHRRSRLIELTQTGRDRLVAAQEIEAHIVDAIGQNFAQNDLEVTARTLTALEKFFDTPAWTELRHRYFD
jgi:DNA-binding MarR family transcriptional regulator